MQKRKREMGSIAIFVDGDNFNPLGLTEVFQKTKELGGCVIVKRVYGDFTEGNMNLWRDLCIDYNLQTIQCWRRHQKNTVDMKMACDIHDLIYTKPDIQTYILCTGDRDFIEVIQRVHYHGKRVIGLSTNSKGTSKSFQYECDEFHFLGQDSSGEAPKPPPAPVLVQAPAPAPVQAPVQVPAPAPVVSTKIKTKAQTQPDPAPKPKKKAQAPPPPPPPAPPLSKKVKAKAKAKEKEPEKEKKLTRAEKRQLKRLSNEAMPPLSPKTFKADFMENVDENYIFEDEEDDVKTV